MLLLRGVNKRRWEWAAGTPPWLQEGEIPAAALSDLRAGIDSELSVWYVDSAKSNLSRIIAGVAAKRENPDKFDYVLFPEELLDAIDIAIGASEGDSFDLAANKQWHRDLVKLTGEKLIGLARLIRAQAEIDRVPERRVSELIIAGIDRGEIERGRLNEPLLKHLFPEG